MYLLYICRNRCGKEGYYYQIEGQMKMLMNKILLNLMFLLFIPTFCDLQFTLIRAVEICC